MGQLIRLALVILGAILFLYACNLFRNRGDQNQGISGELTAVRLTVQATNAADSINYGYTVANTGSTPLTGPVTVTDDKVTGITCPDVSTVGNQNASLDQGESVICTGKYVLTPTDISAGQVITNSTAKVGEVTSAIATTTVRLAENKVLNLAKSADVTTYDRVGQIIKYSYTITNTGAAPVGPTQFVIRDDRISAPINCGAAGTQLATNQTVSCTAEYTITANDMAATQIKNTATASGGGAGVIQPATVTIQNANPPGGSGNLTRGSTVQHQVKEGEWMLQIARCYGADFSALVRANPQVTDADLIFPFPKTSALTVPNIGSNGPIYGPQDCVVFYTVQAGDTWNSIAQKYNADLAVLQEANRGAALSAGTKLKIPRNSAGSGSVTPQPPSSEATRINIPAGSTSTSVSGTVTSSGKVRYVLSATQGQTLNLTLKGPANQLALAVYAPNGTALKAQDTVTTWNGTIQSTGDHFIEVVSVLVVSNKDYTLDVSLTTPTQLPPGVQRVADINTETGSSPAYLEVFNNVLYFSATGSDNAGNELWKYDGAAPPSRVQDINVGAGGSDPAYLTEFNGALYFKATGDNAGAELWRFNGSAVGRVADINTSGDSNPSHLAAFKNMLYFSANGNDGNGVELWKTDGTTVSLAFDIHDGSGDSNPSYLTVFNEVLYFSATSNDGKGTELWKYDGTNPPTRVTDINPEVGNSNPAYLAVFNRALYFSANDGRGVELWKFDGTNASLGADINPAGDSAPTFMTEYNGALYFGALGNDGSGYELWKFDGTTPSLVADISKAGDSTPAYLAVYNGELYFQARGGDGAGKELWKYKSP